MTNEWLKEVSEKLGKVFSDMGYTIDVDKTYLNSVVVNDQGEQVVDYSQSLSWAIMEKVQADELPKFSEISAGVFTRPWTFDPAHGVAGLDIMQVNINGRVVVESYRDKRRSLPAAMAELV